MEPTSLGGRGLRHRVVAVLVAAAIALTFASLFAPPAHADSNADEAQFFTLLNVVRAKNGVPPLATDGQLISVARGWSSRMAGDGGISHNPDIGSQITNWRSLGENVGTGGDVLSIEAALEASPHHFENMVDPNFNYVGIGVVEAGGAIWVTEDFKQAKSGSLPSTQVPAPAPKPAPRPAPRPAAAPAPARSAAPSTRTGVHTSAASPAAVANAAAPSAGANGASAAPAPSALPPSSSESAESATGGAVGHLPPGLAVVSTSPVMDGPRAASLILFSVIAFGLVYWTKGRLPGVPRPGEVMAKRN
jgi:hypothetical protein